jgi:hypothetical protein
MERLSNEFPDALSSVSLRREGLRIRVLGGGLSDTPADRELATHICKRAKSYMGWWLVKVRVYAMGSWEDGDEVPLANC